MFRIILLPEAQGMMLLLAPRCETAVAGGDVKAVEGLLRPWTSLNFAVRIARSVGAKNVAYLLLIGVDSKEPVLREIHAVDSDPQVHRGISFGLRKDEFSLVSWHSYCSCQDECKEPKNFHCCLTVSCEQYCRCCEYLNPFIVITSAHCTQPLLCLVTPMTVPLLQPFVKMMKCIPKTVSFQYMQHQR